MNINTKYKGEFKYCNMHGHGVWTLADDEKYEVEWKDGNIIKIQQ